MIGLSITLFAIAGLIFLIAGIFTALSILWFILKWGLILTGVYLLIKEFVKFLE